MKTKNILIAICLLLMVSAISAQSSINITSPVNGTTVSAYSLVHVTWANTPDIQRISVVYYPDNNSGSVQLGTYLNNNPGYMDIVIPNIPSVNHNGALYVFGSITGGGSVNSFITFNVTSPGASAITVDLGNSDTLVCQQTTLQFTPSINGGTPPYTIAWTGGVFNYQLAPLCICDTLSTYVGNGGTPMAGLEYSIEVIVTDATGLRGYDSIHISTKPVVEFAYPLLADTDGIQGDYGATMAPCGAVISVYPRFTGGAQIVSAQWRLEYDHSVVLSNSLNGPIAIPDGFNLLELSITDQYGCVENIDSNFFLTHCNTQPVFASDDCFPLGLPDSVSGTNNFYFLHVLDNDIYDTSELWNIHALNMPNNSDVFDPPLEYSLNFTHSADDYLTLAVPGGFLGSLPDSFQYVITCSHSPNLFDTAWVRLNVTCPPPTGLVWPGDADNNGVVSNTDLLAIGLGYGSTGTARPGASLTWAGQPCADWADTLADGTNYKFIDCDGNGTINADDTLAIQQNFFSVHARNNNDTYRTGAPTLNMQVVQDTVSNGDTLHLVISLGDANTPANNVYGIAFDVNFNPNVVDTHFIFLRYNNSWLGTTSELISVTKYFKPQGNIKTAETRYNHVSHSGHGPLATVDFLITTSNINGKDMEYYQALFSVSNITMVDQQGNHLDVNASETTSEIGFLPTGLNDPVIDALVKVYPNPAKDRLLINSSQIAIEEIKITDVLGKEVIKMVPANAQNIEMDVSQLSGGVYFLQINTSKGVAIKRLAISK